MAAKDFRFAENPCNKRVNGVNVLADAVKVALGAKGRNVMLERSYGAPTITKDGVSVPVSELPKDEKAGASGSVGDTVM